MSRTRSNGGTNNMTTDVREQELLVLDYPQQDEKITSQQYTIRFGAPQDAAKVEISINGSDWQPCRYSVGFWWFDWSNYLPGQHQISGRVTLQDGDTFTTRTRNVRVVDQKPGDKRR